MELFRNANFDFVGKKWLYVGLSAVLLTTGLVSIFWRSVQWGVDFKGGTLVYVKFTQRPETDRIREAMVRAGLHNARIQRYGPEENHEVIISLELKETTEQALDRGKNLIVEALSTNRPANKQDLNNVGVSAIQQALLARDPLRAGSDANQRYAEAAQAIVNFRDRERRGVLRSLDELKGRVSPEVLAALEQDFHVSDFAVRNVEIVGPQVGQQLRRQALLATLYSMAGMLVYIAFRFEFIYGVAAVAAVVHDTLITIGAFSLTNKEISLTVIAAILTLVGYSMNDTIVIFDRIRENVKLLRRERFSEIVNKSVNQTLGRTVLTSGLTFLTVLSLFLFGGEVLHGFSFALVIGILIGTYSSIAVAVPVLVTYQEWRAGRGRGTVPVPADSTRKEKARAKA
ncbi:MAG TPA: protein translocase subunit SecF [Terriglobales bacterium]|jgi:preprotein translocase subunit SecF|nr:protein translocase subunit SecF [Terriglobales bacterium]